MGTLAMNGSGGWLHYREVRQQDRLDIGALAQRILRDEYITFPPVPIVNVCRALGVDVSTAAGVDWDGYADPTTRPAKIVANGSHSEARQRFTIAHELGHLLLHKPSGVQFRDVSIASSDPMEREANRFAAEILMPRSMLDVILGMLDGSPRVLAPRFLVSERAMAIRLSELYGWR